MSRMGSSRSLPGSDALTRAAGEAGGSGKYRKRPVVVDAVQFMPDGEGSLAWPGPLPEWLDDAFDAGVLTNLADRVEGGRLGNLRLEVKTLEGPIIASPGDWIIRGVKDELYPCKPDVFAATFDPADDAPQSEG